MNKRILICGLGQLNYIFQLYREIKSNVDSKVVLNSIGLAVETTDQVKESYKIFEENYNYDDFALSNYKKFIIAKRVLLKKYFYQEIFFELSEGKISNYLAYFKRHYDDSKKAYLIDNFTNSDILHLHFPTKFTSGFCLYLTKKYKIITVFWGSDIYRTYDNYSLYLQKNIIDKSTFITVTTNEMRFVALVKFGFDIFEKIKIVKFVLQDDFFEIAASDTIIDLQLAKQKYNLPIDKKIVLFGNNASVGNQHLKFIESLGSWNKQTLEQYHFVFHLSYSGNRSYIQELMEKSKPYNFTFIFDYFDTKQLYEFKSCVDLYIHAPITDGLSAYLIEFFYLNKHVILGEWLPYSTFEKLDLDYLAFTDFNDLENLIQETFNSVPNDNKVKIDKSFRKNSVIKNWINIINDCE